MVEDWGSVLIESFSPISRAIYHPRVIAYCFPLLFFVLYLLALFFLFWLGSTSDHRSHIPTSTLFQYIDSDFARSKIDWKSTGSYVFILTGVAICYSSKLKWIVALSICEAEYIAIYKAGKEVVCWDIYWLSWDFGKNLSQLDYMLIIKARLHFPTIPSSIDKQSILTYDFTGFAKLYLWSSLTLFIFLQKKWPLTV